MKSNKGLQILNIIMVVMLLAAIVANVVLMTTVFEDISEFIPSTLFSLTAVFAVFYLVVGCNKAEGAEQFHTFIILLAICYLYSVVAGSKLNHLVLALNAIPYGCLCILAVAKDLGKKKSLALSLIVGVLSVVKFIVLATLKWEVGIIIPATSVLLSISTVIMVVLKYRDKALRGRAQ